MTINTTETFQDIILSEFLKRKERNQAYSLRAYAQHLCLDQSLLSKILKNKRKPSKKVIEGSLRTLGYKDRTIQRLMRSETQVASYRALSDDEFEILSDWVHFGILQLMTIKGFQSDPKWIAKRLCVTRIQVEKALGRLERIGKIEKVEDEYKVKTNTHSWDNLKSTSIARRLFQKKLLELSAKKIEKVDFSLRENSSLTIACNKSLLPEVKERIFNFKKELDAFISNHGNEDEVYQLVVGFFPLTDLKNNLEKK